jgi:serine protease Do
MNGVMVRIVLLLCLMLSGGRAGASTFRSPEEGGHENAYLQAVEKVRSKVVRIDTIGGKERVGRDLAGGPATGLLLDAEGYLLTSGFHLRHEPSAISVRLPDGKHAAARVVAVDHSDNFVLLKIERPFDFEPMETGGVGELRVGQWVVAVGQALSPERPNLAVGILSAKNRVWGKAIQTDAAVGPNNYGGPLIDLQGRVLGILTPLSPMAEGDSAGFEWYDSGIGMAVPIERAFEAADRMRSGDDLHEGRAGLKLPVKEMFIQEAVVLGVLPRSPAENAGIQKGDRITSIDGKPVQLAVDALVGVRSRYAGDSLSITLQRDGKPIQVKIVLERPSRKSGTGPPKAEENGATSKK